MTKTAKVPVTKTGKAVVPPEGGEGGLFQAMQKLHDDIDKAFGRVFQHDLFDWPHYMHSITPFRDAGAMLGFTRMAAAPSADMTETAKGYEIAVELPGVEEADLSVKLSDHMLTIEAEKKVERDEDKKGYHLSERRYGKFYRSFRLPEDVTADKIGATFAKGVLTVTMPKDKRAKPALRKIAVKAA